MKDSLDHGAIVARDGAGPPPAPVGGGLRGKPESGHVTLDRLVRCYHQCVRLAVQEVRHALGDVVMTEIRPALPSIIRIMMILLRMSF